MIVFVSIIVDGGNRELTVLGNESLATGNGCLDVPAKHCLVYYIMFVRRKMQGGRGVCYLT